jgi:hypothetical protein
MAEFQRLTDRQKLIKPDGLSSIASERRKP